VNQEPSSAKGRTKKAEERAFLLMHYDAGWRAAKGITCLAGVDEVGRGALAGPLVAAAVILPENTFLPGLDDSKRLLPAERLAVAKKVAALAWCWSVAFVPAGFIDAHGLTAANAAAMRTAVSALPLLPELVLSDGYPIGDCPWPNVAVVHGDGLSQSIAAASCLAKVVRDAWMKHLGEELYPGYGLERNAGYATAEHRRAVAALGITAEHRLLFLSGGEKPKKQMTAAGVLFASRGEEEAVQMALFTGGEGKGAKQYAG